MSDDKVKDALEEASKALSDAARADSSEWVASVDGSLLTVAGLLQGAAGAALVASAVFVPKSEESADDAASMVRSMEANLEQLKSCRTKLDLGIETLESTIRHMHRAVAALRRADAEG